MENKNPFDGGMARGMDYLRALATLPWKRFLPENEKYQRIAIFLVVAWAIAALPLYFIGMTNDVVRPVVYWIWRTSIFGVWDDSWPYSCGYVDQPYFCGVGDSRGVFSFSGLVMFATGPFLSVRLLVLCLQLLETALGTDIISRLLNRFLPDNQRPEKPDK